jgi:anti-sigma-K factor RskA
MRSVARTKSCETLATIRSWSATFSPLDELYGERASKSIDKQVGEQRVWWSARGSGVSA